MEVSVSSAYLIGMCLSKYLHALGLPIILAFAMGAVVLICSYFIQELPVVIKLSAQISIGTIAYLALSWFFQRNLFSEVIGLLPLRFGLGRFAK